MKTVDYDIFCNDDWVAGANDLDEALSYAHQYREEGRVEVYEVQKESTLVAKMSMIRKVNE